MTLHDRIMGLKLVTETNDVDTGYNYGIDDAAEAATEADELMALLAEFIEGCGLGDEDDYTAMLILKKYNTYKERNNGQ